MYQGDPERDADLPRPFEAAWVGNSTFRKGLWLLFFFVSQVIRVPYLKSIKQFDRWVLANWMVELSFLAAMGWLAGPKALAYLFFATVFSIGLHPLGARWIQEHYIVHEQQETYSYYGPLNAIAFNVGYHNEHHDFMSVPWSRLPAVRATAPEFYDNLYWHRSWSALLWRFLTDPGLSLYSRVIREKPAQKAVRPGLAAVQPEAPAAQPVLGT
jgi:sphingolipid delta-4 desaturase